MVDITGNRIQAYSCVLAIEVEARIGSAKLEIFVFEVGVRARISLQRGPRELVLFNLRTYVIGMYSVFIGTMSDSDG